MPLYVGKEQAWVAQMFDNLTSHNAVELFVKIHIFSISLHYIESVSFHLVHTGFVNINA